MPASGHPGDQWVQEDPQALVLRQEVRDVQEVPELPDTRQQLQQEEVLQAVVSGQEVGQKERCV